MINLKKLYRYLFLVVGLNATGSFSIKARSNDSSSILNIKTSVTSPGSTDYFFLFLVSLKTNNKVTDTVSDVEFELFAKNRIRYRHFHSRIGPGEVISFIDSIHIDSGNSYYKIRYKFNGRKIEEVESITLPTKQSINWIAIIPAVSTFLGALIGAWVVHFFYQ